MLGVPSTRLAFFNSDLLTEPVSEGCFVLPSVRESERLGLLHFVTEARAVHHLPVLLASVFRPSFVWPDLYGTVAPRDMLLKEVLYELSDPST